MPKDKNLRSVFNVVADYRHLPAKDWGARALDVRAAIAGLARRENVTLVHHEHQELILGAPSILIEMPHDFAEKLRGLPHVLDVTTPHYPTKPMHIQPK